MKRLTRYVLIFIVALHTVALLTGCSYRHKPKAYLCIEKPPIKVTYIDFHRDITPQTVDMVMSKTYLFPYQKMKMNNENTVTVSYDAEATHTTSDSKKWEIKK